jgi:ribonucleoside-diphosphate reductase alpha chain
MEIHVIKRNGKKEKLNLTKIQNRIVKQTYGLDKNFISPFEVAKKVIDGIVDNITTRQLDELAYETAAALTVKHPDYSTLAARLALTALHKETKPKFSQTVEDLFNYFDDIKQMFLPIVSRKFNDFVQENKDELDSAIINDRDLEIAYFGYNVLAKSYLYKINGRVAERPQYMYMRAAIQVSNYNLEEAIKVYNQMSQGYYTHATPTLFNSGSDKNQLSSCFLLDTDDSIEGIFDGLKRTAQISKYAGGIGKTYTKVRGSGTYISGTNGVSNGPIPFLKIENETARAVDQGGGKRKGSIAIYMEPWHPEIWEFLELRKNTGKEEMRARDLFLALWVPDLFMDRVRLDEDWTLMCPTACPGLTEVYGDEFKALYEKYEREGRGKKTMKAQELWHHISDVQTEGGTPYILYKDRVNERNNQANIGIIRSSNLCAEITEATGVTKTQKDILANKELLDKLNLSEFWGQEEVSEIAVCNLASVALNKCIVEVGGKRVYSFEMLRDFAYQMTVNLNNVIDTTYYPVPETKFSNLCHRPIAIGVQGLADTFFLLGLPFDSDEAKQLNRDIFEAIYFGAMLASADLAERDGAYATFAGSPLSEGKFQFDLAKTKPSTRWDWETLRARIIKTGVRNSLTTAAMPTASTASIFDNEATTEPITSNLYKRGVLSGEFVILNRHLVKELISLGLWSDSMRNKIMAGNGSIQDIPEIPQNIRLVYRTVWEIKQKDIIQMASDRQPFIDQSQSMNIFMQSPTHSKLFSMHFTGWGAKDIKRNELGELIIPEGDHIRVVYNKDGNPAFTHDTRAGLKTGMYYLRTKGATQAKQFTVTKEVMTEEEVAAIACSLENPESCEACGA